MNIMKILEFIIGVVSVALMLFVFLNIFAIIIVAKLLNLASEYVLVHLASQEFRER
ncbi:hypothetical protein ES703_23986 [subsurface metagenome]